MNRKLIKKLAALTLCAALTLAPAYAQSMEELFPSLQQFPGYGDVTELNWFYDNVRICYETGLMIGTGSGFEPGATLTVAHTATVAARMHRIVNYGDSIIENPAGTSWWTGAVTYLSQVAREQGNEAAEKLLESPTAPITRANFILLLSLVADTNILVPINAVATLPDTDDPVVLDFYRAGILTGMDQYGTFAGDQILKRSECAAVISRMIRDDLRKSVMLQDYSSFTAAGVSPGTVFFSNGVSAERYLSQVDELIFRLEDACRAHDLPFNWYNTFGDQSFLDYVKENALTELGVTRDMGTEAYENFDVQIYYSRLLDLTGEGEL